MGKKIRLVFGFICLFFLFPLNMEAQKNKTEAGKVIDKVVKVGEKAVSYTHLTLPTILRV